MNASDLVRMAQPEHLNQPPAKVGLKKAKEITKFGCQSEFIIAYSECVRTANTSAVPRLDVPGASRIMDLSVYNVLLTLIKSSVCKNPDRARAYFNIFLYIAQINCDTLTENRLFEALAQYAPMGVYENEIVKAIYRCVFGVNEIGVEWLDMAEFFNPYPDTMHKALDLIEKNCSDIKELKTYIKKIAEEMKADKQFKKATMNKYMAPVVWASLA